jgi:chromosomal replication initiation ATPase DnaA
LEELLETVCCIYGSREHDLRSQGRQQKVSEARAMAAVIIRESRQLRLVDLAALLDRDLSGLSQGARRLEGKLRGDKELRKRLEEIRNILNIPICQA